MRRPALALTATLAAGLAVTAAPPAQANGRPPASVKLVFRPGNTTDILAGVTFGLMVSRDDAQTWRWICESAVGFQGTFDPDYELTASGTIWATTFEGLRFTRDGCTWSGVPAPLGSWLVTAIAVSPDGGTVYAGAADPVLGSGIFKSTDDGLSFQATGDLGRVFDWFDTLVVSPSHPERLYGTGYRVQSGQPRQKILFRSMDAGQSWELLPVVAFGGTDISDIQIAAVSPTDPDHVYVRLTFAHSTIGEAIYRTTTWSTPLVSGGPTWSVVLDLPTYINGVVVREDGSVLAATQSEGLHRSTDGGATFEPVSGVTYEARCLNERPTDGSLWMCANHLPPDLMAVGRSTTGAAGSWEVKLRYQDMIGPVRCTTPGNQRDDCEANLWCGTKDQFGVTSGEIDCTDAGVDGPGMPQPPRSCCDAGGPPGPEVGLGALGLLLLRRRRRATAAR